MIAYLSGQVLSKTPNAVVIDVGGIGYAVNVPPSVSASVSVGQSLQLHTSFIVREESQSLFGFVSTTERELFETMLGVSGVGPRSALAIVSSLSVDEVALAVQSQNEIPFTKVPGIGPKTAKLITVSLSGKFKLQNAAAGASGFVGEVVQALIGLGYPEKQANAAVVKAGIHGSSAELLKATLQILSERNV